MLAAGLLASGTPASAQEEVPPLQLSVTPRGAAPSFRLGEVLGERPVREALDAGLPLRIVVAVELWEDRFFDSQKGRTDWRATVLYDPLSAVYQLRMAGEEVTEQTLETLEAAERVLRRTVRPPLRPEEGGRYYYTATLEVETFSASDLEELQRWLQGDLAPAVAGEGNVDDALGDGVRRLLVRLLGLPTRKFRTRTPTFEYRPTGGEGLTPPPSGAP